MIAAHRFYFWKDICAVTLGALAFSLASISVYLINDLLDVRYDRDHPTKRHRALASGQIDRRTALQISFISALGSFALAGMLPPQFVGTILLYLLLAHGYSLFFKRVPVLDLAVLTLLYLVRIESGGAALHVGISSWLLGFSSAFFFSLAALKRLIELPHIDRLSASTHRRGYSISDRPLLTTLGALSGCLSIYVLALFVTAESTRHVYHTPEYLWGLIALTAVWLLRSWFLACRGRMHDDPVVFVLRDPFSYMLGLLGFACMMLASV